MTDTRDVGKVKRRVAYAIKCAALNQPQMGVDWSHPSNARWLDAADAVIALVDSEERDARVRAEGERDAAVRIGLRFLTAGCEQHIAEIGRMAFVEYMEKNPVECVPCLRARLAAVEEELTNNEAERDVMQRRLNELQAADMHLSEEIRWFEESKKLAAKLSELEAAHERVREGLRETALQAHHMTMVVYRSQGGAGHRGLFPDCLNERCVTARALLATPSDAEPGG